MSLSNKVSEYYASIRRPGERQRPGEVPDQISSCTPTPTVSMGGGGGGGMGKQLGVEVGVQLLIWHFTRTPTLAWSPDRCIMLRYFVIIPPSVHLILAESAIVHCIYSPFVSVTDTHSLWFK